MSRRTLTSGAILLRSTAGQARIERLRENSLLIEIAGSADRPLLDQLLPELAAAIPKGTAGRVYLDTALTTGQTTEFREGICRWVAEDSQRHLHILVADDVAALGYAVAGVSQQLSTYRDRGEFDRAMRGRTTTTTDDSW